MKKITLSLLLVLFGFDSSAAYRSSAPFAYMLDYDTGAVLFDSKASEVMQPASMTKIMTAYIVFQKLKEGSISLDSKFTVSERAWRVGGASSGGSTMFLNPRSKVSVEDLLKGIIIQSGNDACIVAAENIAGSEKIFVELMNEEAHRMGLKNTHFTNATGLPEKEHYTTAEDLAVMGLHTIRDFPEFYKLYAEKSFTYNKIVQPNRNNLLFAMPGVADGIKTGHSSKSGYGMVGSARKDGRRIIMVINGLKDEKSRAGEANRFVGYGLSAFENITLYKKGDILTTVPVWLGSGKELKVSVKNDLFATMPKIKPRDTKIVLSYDSPVKAPIKAGDAIGTITISHPELPEVYTAEVVAAENMGPAGFWQKAKEMFKHYVLKVK